MDRREPLIWEVESGGEADFAEWGVAEEINFVFWMWPAAVLQVLVFCSQIRIGLGSEVWDTEVRETQKQATELKLLLFRHRTGPSVCHGAICKLLFSSSYLFIYFNKIPLFFVPSKKQNWVYLNYCVEETNAKYYLSPFSSKYIFFKIWRSHFSKCSSDICT